MQSYEITLQEFKVMLSELIETWIPKMMVFNSAPENLHDIITNDGHTLYYLVDILTHSQDNILQAMLNSVITDGGVKLYYHGWSISGKFIEWCNKQKVKFLMGGPITTLSFMQINFATVTNVKFKAVGAIITFVDCDCSSYDDKVLDIRQSEILSYRRCILSSRLLNQLDCDNVRFEDCEGLSVIKKLHVKERVRIIIKDDKYLPDTFHFLSSCSLEHFVFDYNGILSSKHMTNLCHNLNARSITWTCFISDDFKPLTIMLIQNISTFTSVKGFSETNIRFNRACAHVIRIINNELDEINSTTLLNCQEELIETGYAKYARL